MKKYDLFRSGDSIIRVLDIQDDKILIIDCINRKMPVWMKMESLEFYSGCTENELYDVSIDVDSGKKLSVCTDDELFEATGFTSIAIDTLDSDQRKVMYERYTMITPILPFISDDKMRSRLICSIAEDHQVSKQTVRNYLCEYLVYMEITALAPKKRKADRELTQNEKNIRWALNKYFYTTEKQSLNTAYTMMLKEKYCDSMGVHMSPVFPIIFLFCMLLVTVCKLLIERGNESK